VQIFSGITDAQCTDGVELMVDSQLIFNGTILYRPVGDSFNVSCGRCGSGALPNWLDLDGKKIQEVCSNTNICSAKNAGVRELRVLSFTELIAGTYKCSRTLNGTVTISLLG